MQITSGRIPGALKVCVYGPEGIGKTTLASQFPEPLYIDTEGSTAHMDVRRLPKPDAWSELLGEVEYIRLNPHLCKTLVIDTVDWAERLCCEHICARDQKTGIEDFGYGKGYKFAQEEFGHLLDALEAVRAKGVHIVLCCHAALRKFEQPDELGAYDRWGMKLIDAPRASIAAMIKEWCDMVLFVNYKTIVVNVDGKGANKGKNKVQGGKRVMYTTHNPCWDAKNRFGLPEEVDFSYEAIRSVIEGVQVAMGDGAKGSVSSGAPSGMAAGSNPANTSSDSPSGCRLPQGGRQEAGRIGAAEQHSNGGDGARVSSQAAQRGAQSPPLESGANSHQDAQTLADGQPEASERATDIYAELPPALGRMMREAGVTPDEVRLVIFQRTGVYTTATPWPIICKDQNFINGWLLHPNVWPKVVETAKANRENIPF